MHPDTPALSCAFSNVLEHLATVITRLSRAATISQRARLSKEALLARGQWASVEVLMRALTSNEAAFSAVCRRGLVVDHLSCQDRSFAVQYILAAAYLLCGPARASFWENVSLSDWDAALTHPQRVLCSDKFKTSYTYGEWPCGCCCPPPTPLSHLTHTAPLPPSGTKALHLVPKFIVLVKQYLRGVRPHCRAGDGVVLAPDTTGSAPLLLNPRSGGGLCKMSRLLVAFFMATAGVHITATRLRSIMHSAVHTHCSSRQLREYSRGDTHSSRTAEVHYLKVTSPLFRPPLLHSPPPSTTIYRAQIAAVDVGVRAASAHATMLQAAVPMPEGEVRPPPPPPLPVAVLPADPDPRPQEVGQFLSYTVRRALLLYFP